MRNQESGRSIDTLSQLARLQPQAAQHVGQRCLVGKLRRDDGGVKTPSRSGYVLACSMRGFFPPRETRACRSPSVSRTTTSGG